MTKGAAKMTETDVVIFQTGFDSEKPEVMKLKIETKSSVVEPNNRIDLKGRFARLKKSLRKRSVSIL